MNRTPLDVARVFIGTEEVSGTIDNPQILAMLKLDNKWPENDEVPWCSAFVNYICKLGGLPRSKSLLARSWLEVADEVKLEDAEPGFDIVVLKRGGGEQPGPENTTASGHVGFYVGHDRTFVRLLGGNQGDSVKESSYHVSRILSIRRLPESAE